MADKTGESQLPPLPKDPVIEVYKRDVDRTLIRENLKLTPDQRVRKMLRIAAQVKQMRGAARRKQGSADAG